jgi:SAM-dependent methyltransferase
MDEHLYEVFYRIEDTHWWFVARREILTRYLRQRLGANPRTILDAGCGTGAILADLSHSWTVYGMDSSELAIAFCRKRGLRNLFVGTLKEYPEKRTFDVIMLLDVIEHIDDDRDVLQQALVRMQGGSHVLITVPAYQWLWSAHDVVNHHKRRYTKTTLRNVVRSAGFRIEHMTYFNTLLFPLALLRRVTAGLTAADQASDFDIPPRPLNALLRRVFLLEKHLVPRLSLPFGLSVLCWAVKPQS